MRPFVSRKKEINPHKKMNYEIIATLGPASAEATLWQTMLDAGATAFRLNTSHLSIEQLEAWLANLQAFQAKQERAVPVILDLQGSKWRLGSFAPFELVAGQQIALVHASIFEGSDVLPVPHADFFSAAPFSSGEIVLNDAKIRLRIETTLPDRVQARVLLGGVIAPHKGITFTASEYRSESLSEKDQTIFKLAHGIERVSFAISYVRDAAEMARYRVLFGSAARLIAKLERGPAMQEAEQISRSADELWICRGDLGAELGLPAMAEAVARFTAQVRSLPVPAIMAGQVLEHMTVSPTPTRSEVCYLYDTLIQGYHGFVLSDEAAIGRYPIESCRVANLFR